MEPHSSLLYEDLDVDDVDGRDAIDAEGDALLLSVDLTRESWALGAALTLVSLCWAWAFAKAEPEGSRRNSDPNKPLMLFLFF